MKKKDSRPAGEVVNTLFQDTLEDAGIEATNAAKAAIHDIITLCKSDNDIEHELQILADRYKPLRQKFLERFNGKVVSVDAKGRRKFEGGEKTLSNAYNAKYYEILHFEITRELNKRKGYRERSENRKQVNKEAKKSAKYYTSVEDFFSMTPTVKYKVKDGEYKEYGEITYTRFMDALSKAGLLKPAAYNSATSATWAVSEALRSIGLLKGQVVKFRELYSAEHRSEKDKGPIERGRFQAYLDREDIVIRYKKHFLQRLSENK